MLKTEMRNPRTMHLDRMTTAEMLRVIQDENMNAVKAVDGCLDAVGRAVDAVTEAMRKGGRLIYVGATNGKLRERMVGIVAEIRKVGRDEARSLLEQADWNIKGTFSDCFQGGFRV